MENQENLDLHSDEDSLMRFNRTTYARHIRMGDYRPDTVTKKNDKVNTSEQTAQALSRPKNYWLYPLPHLVKKKDGNDESK